MGLMSVEEYKESLRDDREVYIDGRKVDDVTEDPMLKVGVNTGAVDYHISEEGSPFRDLATTTREDGEVISRYYHSPETSEDLLKRHELMVTATRLGHGIIPFVHDIGADAMNAVDITAKSMGEEKYSKRAENYRRMLQDEDLAVAVAMSDVKGDRHLHPSEQRHPDYYVHKVDEDDEGITVRGAKIHITAAPYCNEIIVIPSRNMREEDSDYAIAFAVPADADGITHLCHPIGKGIKTDSEKEFPVDLPARMHTESMIIFDDVKVPWERVFLCGEYPFALPLVYNFAYMHRHTAASYRIPISETLMGLAYGAAKYNGVENYEHVKEKLTDIAIYVQTLKSLTKSSCIDCVDHEGLLIPNPVLTNLAKYHFATNLHECVKIIQDIAGGIPITAPTYQDYQNPETKEYMDKYLDGPEGVSAEDRLRMMQLIRKMTASDLGGYNEILTLHAEGSPQAQRLMIYAESLEEMEEYKKLAEFAAGIDIDSFPDLPGYKELNEVTGDEEKEEWFRELQELD